MNTFLLRIGKKWSQVKSRLIELDITEHIFNKIFELLCCPGVSKFTVIRYITFLFFANTCSVVYAISLLPETDFLHLAIPKTAISVRPKPPSNDFGHPMGAPVCNLSAQVNIV